MLVLDHVIIKFAFPKYYSQNKHTQLRDQQLHLELEFLSLARYNFNVEQNRIKNLETYRSMHRVVVRVSIGRHW